MRRRRLTRREKRSRRKKAIIVSTLCLLFVMTAGYAAFQTNLSITAKGNIKEPGRIIQSWGKYSNEDFHTDYYKENIVSANFLDTNQVASNATESWDVSEDGKGGVKAWVVPNTEDSTKYDLYIGANGGVIANEDSKYFFQNFINIETISFSDNFNTSNVIDMGFMFRNCLSLKNLDVSKFDTTKVQMMNRMFSVCPSLTTLNLSSFNTRNVIDMQDMFSYSGFINLDLSNFDTTNVTNMQGMFYECTQLTEVNLENFNTDKVNRMYGLFYNCQKLTTLNLCSFNTVNVTNMIDFFRNTTALNSIYVGPNWSTTQADTTNMFSGSGVSSVTTGQC